MASLTEGRHYHGLTSMGLRPMVFGGWNNGSMSSYELLDFGQVAETFIIESYSLSLELKNRIKSLKVAIALVTFQL